MEYMFTALVTALGGPSDLLWVRTCILLVQLKCPLPRGFYQMKGGEQPMVYRSLKSY